MTDDAELRLGNSAHPGAFVKTHIIDPLNLSVTEAAKVLGVTRAALSSFLNGRSSLSPEMALRIEKAFDMSMDTLMRMQSSYDIAQARLRPMNVNVVRYSASRATPSRAGVK
jgi:addiction module HigA family antidote